MPTNLYPSQSHARMPWLFAMRNLLARTVMLSAQWVGHKIAPWLKGPGARAEQQQSTQDDR